MPVKPVCPKCGSKRATVVKDGAIIPDRQCKDCGEIYPVRIPVWVAYMMFGVAAFMFVFAILSFFFDQSGDRLIVMGISLHIGFFFFLVAAVIAFFGYLFKKKSEENQANPDD